MDHKSTIYDERLNSSVHLTQSIDYIPEGIKVAGTRAASGLPIGRPLAVEEAATRVLITGLSVCLHRDIKDTTVGTLSQRITNQVHGLKGLNSKLLDIRSYLERVVAGKLPINHPIIYHLQDVFNLLPDVNLLVRGRWW